MKSTVMSVYSAVFSWSSVLTSLSLLKTHFIASCTLMVLMMVGVVLVGVEVVVLCVVVLSVGGDLRLLP